MSLSIRCEIYGFSTSHVWMWELDHKENWFPNNWWFWTVVLEKTPRDFKDSWTARRSNQSILKETSPKYSLEGLMLKLKLQYFGHLRWRTDSLEKTNAGDDGGQEEKRMTEDEMVGWHHWLNGHGFEQTQEDSEGQGSLACCSPWGLKKLDMTERLNSNTSCLVTALKLHALCGIYGFIFVSNT